MSARKCKKKGMWTLAQTGCSYLGKLRTYMDFSTWITLILLLITVHAIFLFLFLSFFLFVFTLLLPNNWERTNASPPLCICAPPSPGPVPHHHHHHHHPATPSNKGCGESIWRIPADQTKPTQPGCCLSSARNSSTQIRLGFLNSTRRQGEKAAERPLPF